MTPQTFSEPLRYEYPLELRSMVLDVGAYEGNFAREINRKYKCRVDSYEPVKRFYVNTAKNLEAMDKIRVYHAGVAGSQKMEKIHIQNDSSGVFAGSDDVEECRFVSIQQAVGISGVRQIDLLKLNCEGMEYEILDAILIGNDWTGQVAKRFSNIQVQFHTCVPDYQRRYDAIAGDLSQTHECIWRSPFVWESWSLKK